MITVDRLIGLGIAVLFLYLISLLPPLPREEIHAMTNTEPGRDIDPDELPEGLDPKLAFDLDAWDSDDAIKAEATRKPIPIKVGGRWIPFPQMSEWPYEASEALDRSDLRGAVEAIWAEDDTLTEAENTKRAEIAEHLTSLLDRRITTVSKMFEVLTERSGVGLGELNRSARRSRRRGRR